MPRRRFVMNLRLPPQRGPRRYAHDYPRSGQNSRAIPWRPMLMLNYHTNARNGTLVRFNPAVRSRRAPAPPHPGALQPASKPSPACPATPSRLPPRPLHFAPHPPPHPAPCSVPRPRPISARTVLGFRSPVRVYAKPCLGSAALSACTPNRAWVPQPCPRVRPRRAWLRGAVPSPVPDRTWFRVPPRSAATPFGSKAPPPSNSGLRSCLPAFRSCSPTASPVG